MNRSLAARIRALSFVSLAACPLFAHAQAPAQDSLFVPDAAPKRLLDTRTGYRFPTQAYATERICRSPHAAATAMAINVTVTGAQQAGFLTVYPSGGARPEVSNLNFVPGQDIANGTVIRLGSRGCFEVFNGSSGFAHIIVDQTGYFRDPAKVAPGYNLPHYGLYPIMPFRAFDTATDADQSTHLFPANRPSGIRLSQLPAEARGAVVNITSAGAMSPGFISVWPGGAAQPNTSILNFQQGEARANLGMVGTGDLWLNVFSSAPTRLITDVTGFFANVINNQGYVAPIAPVRIVDTRRFTPGRQATGLIPANSIVSVPVLGARQVGQPTSAGIPSVTPANRPVGAVLANVTVISRSPSGATVTAGSPNATTSSVNVGAGRDVANLALLPVGSDGTTLLYNNAVGAIDFIIDVQALVSAKFVDVDDYENAFTSQKKADGWGWGSVRMNCGVVTCTVYFSRQATNNLNVGVGEVAAMCGMVAAAGIETGPGAGIGWAICELVLSTASFAAGLADDKDACLRVKFLKHMISPPVITWVGSHKEQHCVRDI